VIELGVEINKMLINVICKEEVYWEYQLFDYQ